MGHVRRPWRGPLLPTAPRPHQKPPHPMHARTAAALLARRTTRAQRGVPAILAAADATPPAEPMSSELRREGSRGRRGA